MESEGHGRSTTSEIRISKSMMATSLKVEANVTPYSVELCIQITVNQFVGRGRWEDKWICAIREFKYFEGFYALG